MAKKEMNISQWVDERLAALHSRGEWQPDPEQGLARLRERRRVARRRRMEWMMAAFASAAACIALMIFASPGACARPNSCSSDQPTHPNAPAAPPAAQTAPVPAPAKPVAATKPAPVKPAPPAAAVNFKESGSASAPIVCEIYTDYECPSCALLYKDTIPLLVEQYVRTGKIRLVHRDFPLPQHQYARLAARFANAAGLIGQYDLVVNRLFQTQTIWGSDGNVDAQVMQVLAPGSMQKVRELVAGDPRLDDTLNDDLGMANKDHVDRTPTLVIVSGGRRQSLAGVPQFSILKTYLDQLLAGR